MEKPLETCERQKGTRILASLKEKKKRKSLAQSQRCRDQTIVVRII